MLPHRHIYYLINNIYSFYEQDLIHKNILPLVDFSGLNFYFPTMVLPFSSFRLIVTGRNNDRIFGVKEANILDLVVS